MKKIFIIALSVLIEFAISNSTHAATNKLSENDKKEVASFDSKNLQPIAMSTTEVKDSKGKHTYTITRYNASSLPFDVFEKVKVEYTNFYINGIEKVEAVGNDNPVYIVHMEDKNSIKTVTVHDNDVDLVSDFKKG